MEVDEFAVVQVVHDVDLFPDEGLLHRVRDGNKFGRVNVTGLDLAASGNNRKMLLPLYPIFSILHTGIARVCRIQIYLGAPL